ncbi:MAG: SDR family NAD(P)-dependent oxidoreductase [Thermoprotei archaeon]
MVSVVLVTGGAGFIGSWTCELLVEKGYDVVIVDDFSSGSIENIEHIRSRARVVRADIRDYDRVEEIVRKYRPDAVIHLAARVSVEEVGSDPRTGYDVNVTGTLNLLEVSRKYDVDRFIYASSAAVYGEPVELPVKENHPLKPVSIYGATKLAGEVLVHAYHGNYGLSTIALRYFNVYGPRMRSGPYAGVVYKFLEAVLLGKPLVIYGDGEQTRDFIYVSDVARANLYALEKSVTGAYNIGTGKAVSINDLAKTVISLIGNRNVPIIYEKPRRGDIRHSCADITRAVRDLGWKPEVDLLTGLKITLKYIKTRLSRSN